MKALRYDGGLRLVDDAPIERRAGEALIQVLTAGICNTDLEITRGYAGFRGTLGHEFVGRVVEAPDKDWLGKRVVGEINVGCGVCALCAAGDARHCPTRTVLGIKGRDGAFAEYLCLPPGNLLAVPDAVADEEAVFVEPLAAACRILEQVDIHKGVRLAVIGDGKLAQLIVRLLAQTGALLTVIGRHQDKLERLEPMVAQTIRLPQATKPESAVLSQVANERFDLVIEASGSPGGLPLALSLVTPQGTIILKSTHHAPASLDLSQLVVNEVKILGSRCGRFQPALDLLAGGKLTLQPLISGRFAFADALTAFETAAQPDSLKVLLRVADR